MIDFTSPILFPELSGQTKKEVTAHFDGGDCSSDGGILLLARADAALGLTSAIEGTMRDRREVGRVRHSYWTLIRERVFGVALGYYDCAELQRLKRDPAFLLACAPQTFQGGHGRQNHTRAAAKSCQLASQPTLSRLENAVSRTDLLRVAYTIGRKAIAQVPANSREVTVELDSTDDPCHGGQEGEGYNSHYRNHCYLPLLVHVTGSDGVRWQVAAVLRPGNAPGTQGFEAILKRVVAQIRQRCPRSHITVRCDAGFCGNKILTFCESLGLSYTIGLSAYETVQKLGAPHHAVAVAKYEELGENHAACQNFVDYGEFQYAARSWPHPRRVIVKTAITWGVVNPRYVVTNLPERQRPSVGSVRVWDAKAIYHFYCQRGDEENAIKQLKLDLGSGRTSCTRFRANTFRLLLHSAALLLIGVLQKALVGTRYGSATAGRIRLRLFKVAAKVVTSCRRVTIHLPSFYPDKDIWFVLQRRLPPRPT